MNHRTKFLGADQLLETLNCQFVVGRLDFNPDTVPTRSRSSDARRGSPGKGIEDCVPDEAEHADHRFDKFYWVRRGMGSSRSPTNGYDLFEPSPM